MDADVSPRDRTVLITGGAGFIGSHLAEALLPGNEVIVLDDLSRGERAFVPDGAEFVRGDITEAEDLRRAAGMAAGGGPTVDSVDVIFHLAAVVSVEESVAQPRRSNAVNVDGTLNVLEVARERDATVVFGSSA
ncbi:MAG: NAD-dependent epimerase/dehydratase family protein, partial [Candidatus Nanohaloarchaea archaeon]